ncbi:MAG TPA: hypothetical protein DGR20_02205 [Alphaproteobacteria bacterium]|jgi:Zn-dependent protease with chaperone function|nr:hypothetical protein [Alphaproteobacteria bacterium]|tara:strand:+ start:475 stop:1506 length:1032 start_codon:yes stop_codon:yes gene_type:complete
MRITGEYFEPRSSRGQPAELEFSSGKLWLDPDPGGDGSKTVQVTITKVQGRNDIYFTSGRYFHAHDDLPAGLRRMAQSRLENAISWLTVFSPMRMLVLFLIIVTTLAGFRLAFASFTELTIATFPRDWETEIGSTAFERFEPLAFRHSQISRSYKDSLTDEGAKMAEAAGIKPAPDILFRKAKFMGANALAFPGGPVVLTDQLIFALTRQEVLAVIAHELAHIELRHSLHQVIKVAGVSTLALIVFGAEDIIIENLAAGVITTWYLGNSRDFEREADQRAIEILEASGHDPATLAKALKTLYEVICDQQQLSTEACEAQGSHHWLSTHPGFRERIIAAGGEVD